MLISIVLAKPGYKYIANAHNITINHHEHTYRGVATYAYSYSTARFKLHAHILASTNTFSPSSQPMLASKGSMFASKGSMLPSTGNMLSCMILLAIEVDARVQLLARILHRAISRCTRTRLNALMHYFTSDLNLMLADITRQAFIKC